jgi:hypothetical protein
MSSLGPDRSRAGRPGRYADAPPEPGGLVARHDAATALVRAPWSSPEGQDQRTFMAKHAQVRRRSVLPRVGLLLAGAALPLLWPLTAPAEGVPPERSTGSARTLTVADAAEAWYATSPIDVCSSPLGCPPEQAPTSPYPADTLHVGVAGGQETARTYLLPDLTGLPYGATGVTGVMTLPVASGNQDGTQSAGTATLKACLATKPVTDGAQGSTSASPSVDCNTSATPVYDAKKDVFTLDVSPFLAAWSTGAVPYGIALVPATDKAQPTDVWHVTFNGRHRAKTHHIATVITYSPPPPITGTGGPVGTPAPPPPASVPAPSTGGALPPVGTRAQQPRGRGVLRPAVHP